ncbi:hypothetical protein V5799_029585 [Amblyomma americanum]|uniref:PDZ domain-containing protein n=1 Tax=Amblyomma americanum TaxID=6943 RepID=A0AAQ4EQP2_AMBAM
MTGRQEFSVVLTKRGDRGICVQVCTCRILTLRGTSTTCAAKVFTVALRKSPDCGLGLGILKDGGGASEPGFVRVHELYPGKPAQLCGRLRTGDVILKVNGVRLLGKSTAQALEILRAASGLVTLTIYRQQPEENGNLSVSNLNHCSRTEPEGIAGKEDTNSTRPTSRHARPLSSYLGTGLLSDSTAVLSSPEPPLYANLQPVAPLPKPRLRKSQAQPPSAVVRHLAEPCDFDVVTDGRVFGDLHNGGFCGEKLPHENAAGEPTSQRRRHNSVGTTVAAAGRSSSSSATLLFDDALNGLARHGSSRTVRSCFNSAMFADSCGGDDAGLTRWRDTVLMEESDDSGLSHLRGPVEASRAGEAKLIDAPSLEIECVSVKLNRGWHTKLGFSLQDCDPGARDTPNAPVVKAVYAGSLASRDGRIRVGDFLIQVNGCDFIGCCAKDAVDYIKKCGGVLQLLFIRVHKSHAARDSGEQDK